MSLRAVVYLLKDADTVEPSSPYRLQGTKQQIQAFLNPGTGAATIQIQATNDERASSLDTADDAAWEDLGSPLVLDELYDTVASLTNDKPFAYVRANLVSSSYGTATVVLTDVD